MIGFVMFMLFAIVFVAGSILVGNEGKPRGIRGSRY